MSDHSAAIQELLGIALQAAGEVAQSRVERPLQLVAGQEPTSTALLRFDVNFPDGASLSWFVSNEDATGFSDMLIGGSGDRNAALTDMHLDALSGVFSDMLERAVDGLNSALTQQVAAGGVDMGMEGGLPAVEPEGDRIILAFDIQGFGSLTIVAQANAALVQLLRRYCRPEVGMGGGPAAAAGAPAGDAGAGGGIVPAASGQATGAHAAGAAGAAAPGAPAAPASGVAGTPGAAEAAGGVRGAAAQPPAPGAAAGAPGAAGAAPAHGAVHRGTPHGSVHDMSYDNVVQLPNLTDREPAREKSDLRMLLNVPLKVTVELGSTDRTVRDLLELNVGSILELNKLAGDPMDIMVNGKVLARGEVVVIDEEFGIRVTEIASPEQRLRNLS